MDKIKARTKQIEQASLFFSLLTSNAKEVAKRIAERELRSNKQSK